MNFVSGRMRAARLHEGTGGQAELRVDTDVAIDLMVGPFIYRLILAGGDEAGIGSPVDLLNTVMAGLSPRS